MSTTGGSEQGTVYVLDEPAVIEKKLKSAVTDSGSEVRRAPEKPGVSNLIEILAAIRGVDPSVVEADFAETRYGDFKMAVARAVVRLPGPGARALRAAARRRGRRSRPSWPTAPCVRASCHARPCWTCAIAWASALRG